MSKVQAFEFVKKQLCQAIGERMTEIGDSEAVSLLKLTIDSAAIEVAAARATTVLMEIVFPGK